jgi:predicted thioesterase
MEIGKKFVSTMVVEERHLACQVGSGDLRVLATTVMLALMENAAMLCVADQLDAESTTVGGHIAASHLKPTGIGHTVTATAELTAAEGRKLTFKVSASDEEGLIGEGEHLRFVVGRERFMSKVK